jgi:hypothetical protein
MRRTVHRLAAFALLGATAALPARAAYLVTIGESGGNVVASGSGSLNTGGADASYAAGGVGFAAVTPGGP